MRLSLDEHEQLIVDSVHELGARALAGHGAAWDDVGELPPSVLSELSAAGLFGLSSPEALGGVGLSNVARVAVLEALAGGDATVAWLVAMHDAASWLVHAAGTDAQRRDWLGPWASGEQLVIPCDVTLTRPPTDADGAWVLDGSSAACVGIAVADRFVVWFTGAAGPQAAVVGRQSPGVSVGPRVDCLGVRAGGTAVLELSGVRVPVEDQLGPVDAALRATLRARYRTDLAAMACGVGHAAVQAATRYACEREQFGKAIARFQAIQFKVANAATELEAAALVTRRAAWCVDAGAPDIDAAARAKTIATLAAVRACSEALQIHGGYGYTREFPVERCFRAAKMMQTADGTNRDARRQTAASIRARFSPA